MHPQGIFGLGNKKEEKGQWPNRWALIVREALLLEYKFIVFPFIFIFLFISLNF